MAPRKKVPSLQDLALQAVQEFLLTVSKHIIDDSKVSGGNITADIVALLKQNIPSTLHARIAPDLLQTLEKMLEDYSARASGLLPRCKTIVKQLVAVIPHLKVEEISIRASQWSEVVYSSLVPLLDKMSYLKILTCLEYVDSREDCPLVQQIIDSCPSLSSLTSFTLAYHTTDRLVAGLCENCKALREIIIPHSVQVSSESIRYLVQLKKLEVVDLKNTSVDPQGYYDLLTKSESNSLFHFGELRWPLQFLLILLEEKLQPFRTFPLQRLLFHFSPQADQMRLIAKYFPGLKEFSFNSTAPLYDSCHISKLKNLTHLRFEFIKSVAPPMTVMDQFNRFFSVRGPFITSLSIKSCVVHKSRHFIDIFASCPNIEYFKLENSYFVERLDYAPTIHQQRANPFQKLTDFIMISTNINLALLKYVLGKAVNVQNVTLEMFYEDDITDEFFEALFQSNPLEKLVSLRMDSETSRISGKMLKRIITHCNKISSVANFTSSPIVTGEEVEQFRNFVSTNNYDLVLE